MAAQVISGKALAKKIREGIKQDVERIKQERGFTPGLAVILVGDDPASHTYVNNKEKSCIEVGMNSFVDPNLDSAQKSIVSSNLESQLGKGHKWCMHPTSEASNCSFEGPCL